MGCEQILRERLDAAAAAVEAVRHGVALYLAVERGGVSLCSPNQRLRHFTWAEIETSVFCPVEHMIKETAQSVGVSYG